jgi:hypothetical protein
MCDRQVHTQSDYAPATMKLRNAYHRLQPSSISAAHTPQRKRSFPALANGYRRSPLKSKWWDRDIQETPLRSGIFPTGWPLRAVVILSCGDANNSACLFFTHAACLASIYLDEYNMFTGYIYEYFHIIIGSLQQVGVFGTSQIPGIRHNSAKFDGATRPY